MDRVAASATRAGHLRVSDGDTEGLAFQVYPLRDEYEAGVWWWLEGYVMPSGAK